jgi:Lsr2
MAQRVNVVLVDDLDGSEAAETVNFGLDGASYEIDLSAENATKIREALAVYVGHGRRTGGRRRGGAQGSGAAGRSGAAGASGPSASEIRAWARENGFDVPERGRVSSEVREAFLAAQ